MNIYHIWCNLREGKRDLEFTRAVDAYLGYLRDKGHIASYRVMRRKFGFGPSGLGEFHIMIECESLAQLDDAFGLVATRSDEIEALHRPVFQMAVDFTSALYRDFPDPQRKTES